MRTVFLTALCAAAIGFSTPTPGWSQSAAVVLPGAQTNAAHVSRAGFGAMTMKKSKVNWGVSVDGVKRDASWFKEMRDPCQVEG